MTCEQAIAEFAQQHWSHVPADVLEEFLRLSDVVIKDLLYVRELAERQLYFRRLRLPPQIFVFWDRIMIDNTVKRVLAWLVRDREAALQQGREAIEKMHQMSDLAKRYGITRHGLKHQAATFEIIAASCEYFFGPGDDEIKKQLLDLKSRYKKRFKRNYSVMINFEGKHVHRLPMRFASALMVREKRRYRMVDQVLTIRILGMLYPVVRRLRHRIGPKFAREQAMGLEVLLK